MNILLINNNPVVSRLVSLCMRDNTIVFEEVSSVTEATRTAYDLLFVDDGIYGEHMADMIASLACKKVVYLSSRDSGEEIGGAFDTVIKKPFLPSQICALVDPLVVVDEEEEAKAQEEMVEVPFLFPLSNEEEVLSEEEEATQPLDEEISLEMEQTEPDMMPETQKQEEGEGEAPLRVLDKREVRQIKQLLEESEEEPPVALDLDDEEEVIARKVEIITQRLEAEGLEIVNEEEIVESLEEAPKQKKRKKKKKVMKLKGDDIATLIHSLSQMKPKKLRKLLKGAKVKISIDFKEK